MLAEVQNKYDSDVKAMTNKDSIIFKTPLKNMQVMLREEKSFRYICYNNSLRNFRLAAHRMHR